MKNGRINDNNKSKSNKVDLQMEQHSAIMALTPASCYCIPSFNYGSRKARDIHLTCRSHLRNVLTDSIFYDSLKWGITYCFFNSHNHCFPQRKLNGFCYLIIITPMDLGNP